MPGTSTVWFPLHNNSWKAKLRKDAVATQGRAVADGKDLLIIPDFFSLFAAIYWAKFFEKGGSDNSYYIERYGRITLTDLEEANRNRKALELRRVSNGWKNLVDLGRSPRIVSRTSG